MWSRDVNCARLHTVCVKMELPWELLIGGSLTCVSNLIEPIFFPPIR